MILEEACLRRTPPSRVRLRMLSDLSWPRRARDFPCACCPTPKHGNIVRTHVRLRRGKCSHFFPLVPMADMNPHEAAQELAHKTLLPHPFKKKKAARVLAEARHRRASASRGRSLQSRTGRSLQSRAKSGAKARRSGKVSRARTGRTSASMRNKRAGKTRGRTTARRSRR